MRLVSERFHTFLDSKDVQVLEHFSTQVRKVLHREWRNKFALERPFPKGYDWHTFSYDHAVHKYGKSAFKLYQEQSSSAFVIFPPASSDSTAYLCKAANMPDFSELVDDIYIFNLEFDWTTAFTHEDGLGPYFARKEWQTWFTQ